MAQLSTHDCVHVAPPSPEVAVRMRASQLRGAATVQLPDASSAALRCAQITCTRLWPVASTETAADANVSVRKDAPESAWSNGVMGSATGIAWLLHVAPPSLDLLM